MCFLLLLNKENDFKVVTFLRNFREEVGDDLSVCVLNVLPKVSSLPSLLAINLVKVEI